MDKAQIIIEVRHLDILEKVIEKVNKIKDKHLCNSAVNIIVKVLDC